MTALTVGYYASFVILGLVSAVLGPTLAGLAEHTRASISQVGLLFTSTSLGYLVGSFYGGRLFDRLPGQPTLAAALLAAAVALALVPLVPALWLLSLVFVLLGAAQGAVDVGGNTLLIRVHGRDVGPAMNGLHFFFGVGAFLSPIIVARLVHSSGDVNAAYWAVALLAVPVAVWVLRQPNPAGQATGLDDGSPQAKRALVALIAAFLCAYVGAEVSMGGWMYTYAVQTALGNAATAAYLTSAFWGALTLGRLLAIPVAARLAPQTMVAVDLGGCLLSLTAILLWPRSPAAVWLGTIGTGLSMASIFPTTLALAERRLAMTGRVTGWFLVGSSLGGMSLPWLVGQVFGSVGPRWGLLVVLADVAVAAAVFTLLHLHSRRAA
jgi:FHS family Na+ dependent glucose MFS transporter 1